MPYQLPPAGNPVQLSVSHNDDTFLQTVFSPYTPRFFNSGTAALAAAILASISIRGTTDPEVILPAYGCPDLISAVVYAGAKPVLVDLEANRPWMDQGQVAAAITADTVAIIAVSLCGMPERLDALRQIAVRTAVMLIEDSAQLFPGSVAEADWQGDMVVISFGRGKPVSLLGGGAVLFQDERFGRFLPDNPVASSGIGQRLAFRMKTQLYNWLIAPRLYWALQWAPFLHIGETRYHQLEDIGPIDSARRRILQANVMSYMQQGHDTSVALSSMIDSLGDERIVNLPVACEVPAKHRLLRYPLLVDSAIRNRVYTRLVESGMGASKMYPGILPAISGVGAVLVGQGGFPMAERFAGQLLTLPVHAGVRRVDIQKIVAVIREICS